MPIDTMNKFMVGIQGNEVVMLLPPPPRLSPDDAMLLAAYLVALAEHKAEHSFESVLEAVIGT